MTDQSTQDDPLQALIAQAQAEEDPAQLCAMLQRRAPPLPEEEGEACALLRHHSASFTATRQWSTVFQRLFTDYLQAIPLPDTKAIHCLLVARLVPHVSTDQQYTIYLWLFDRTDGRQASAASFDAAQVLMKQLAIMIAPPLRLKAFERFLPFPDAPPPYNQYRNWQDSCQILKALLNSLENKDKGEALKLTARFLALPGLDPSILQFVAPVLTSWQGTLPPS